MPETLDEQIASRLVDVLAGELSVAEFHRWFLPASYNVHQLGDPALEHLVGEVGLVLAERDAGHLTHDQLVKRLRPIAHTHTLRR